MSVKSKKLTAKNPVKNISSIKKPKSGSKRSKKMSAKKPLNDSKASEYVDFLSKFPNSDISKTYKTNVNGSDISYTERDIKLNVDNMKDTFNLSTASIRLDDDGYNSVFSPFQKGTDFTVFSDGLVQPVRVPDGVELTDINTIETKELSEVYAGIVGSED